MNTPAICFIATLSVICCFILYRCIRSSNLLYRFSAYYKATRIPLSKLIDNKGKYGEYQLYKALRHYGAKFLFNLYLPTNSGGITEVDLVMIDQNGILVGESKNYAGKITGSEQDQYWKQTLYKCHHKVSEEYFYNPILQNSGHIAAIKSALQSSYQNLYLYSFIAFSNQSKVKTQNLKTAYVGTVDKAKKVRRYRSRYCKRKLSGRDIRRIQEQLRQYTNPTKDIVRRQIETCTERRNQNEK